MRNFILLYSAPFRSNMVLTLKAADLKISFNQAVLIYSFGATTTLGKITWPWASLLFIINCIA